MKETKSYLKFSALSKIVFWDFYSLSNKNVIQSKFPIVPLKEVLIQRKGFITIDDSIIYKRCRAQVQAKGIILRDEIIGKEIKTKKQQVCKTDDFLVAEIDAKVGGFGIIPDYLEDAIVSGHYFLFEIDKTKLLPEYLGIVIKQNDFFKQIKSTGSTNYAAIRPYHVLEYVIPLPLITEQELLINAYNQKVEQAKQLEKEAEELERGIEEYLSIKLGVKEHKLQVALKGLQFSRFSNSEKWGFEFLRKSGSIDKGKYTTKELREICAISSGGTPSRSNKEFYNGNIPWIKTGEVVNDVIYDTEEKISQDAIDNSSAKVYPKGSLIIAMYGQGATRGRTAKLGIDASTNQACAVLFNIDNSILLTDYIWVFLMNEYERLRAMASGNNQPNLNAGMINNYHIQIPPMEIQQEIVDYFFETKKRIKEIKQQVELNVNLAQKDFENEIFN